MICFHLLAAKSATSSKRLVPRRVLMLTFSDYSRRDLMQTFIPRPRRCHRAQPVVVGQRPSTPLVWTSASKVTFLSSVMYLPIASCETMTSTACAGSGTSAKYSIPSSNKPACRVNPIVNLALGALTCHPSTPTKDLDFPMGAWTMGGGGGSDDHITFSPCTGCSWVVPPGDIVLDFHGGGSSSGGGSVDWKLPNAVSFKKGESDEEDNLVALAYGEPHISPFRGGGSLLVNEVGDFHLFRMGVHNTSEACSTMDLITLVNAFEGVQIRFLPGVWAPQFTMSVSLGMRFAGDTLEIRQNMDPAYTTTTVLNGVVTNDTSTAFVSVQRLLDAEQLAGSGGVIQVQTPLFTLQWSPFSVAIALDPFVTQSGCKHVYSEGLVGDKDVLMFRNTTQTLTDYSPEQVKAFAMSWMVQPSDRSFLSGWMPDVSSDVVVTPNASCFKNRTNSTENLWSNLNATMCWSAIEKFIQPYQALYSTNCSSKKLAYFITVQLPQLLYDCDFDCCATNTCPPFASALQRMIPAVAPPLPLTCDSPLFLSYEKEFRIPVSSVASMFLIGEFSTSNTTAAYHVRLPANVPPSQIQVDFTKEGLLVLQASVPIEFNVTLEAWYHGSANYKRVLDAHVIASQGGGVVPTGGPLTPSPPNINLSGGGIVGIVLAILMCVAVVVWYVVRRRNRFNTKTDLTELLSVQA
eukprot:PhF_6_TR44156/c0_g1_i4/m.67591